MKNIHLLPTDKPSRLYKSKITQNIFISNIISQYGDATYNQHIYITSDEEIKEGEKGWLLENNSITKNVCEFDCSNGLGGIYSTDKKIILTTDQDLIADGVQPIDDNFLEWFVKNPSCEFVEIYQDKKDYGSFQWYSEYKIIIPQEEPKQDPTLENAKLALREYILANKEKVTNDLQEMKEKSGTSKDETLEEAAENYSELQAGTFTPPHKTTYKHGFEDGANWQSRRMYSEEEVLEFANWCRIQDNKYPNRVITIQQLLEQFKKK